MIISSFSQEKLVINHDTVIAITPIQLQKANRLFIERKMYKDFSDSLFKANNKQQAYILTLKGINSLKTKENAFLEDNLSLKDSVISNKQNQIQILNDQLKSTQKKKVKSFFVGTGTGLVISAIILLIKG